MILRIRSIVGLAVVALLLGAAGPALAKKKKGGRGGSTAPGTYTDWKGDIDRLEILETFQRSGYKKIVVGKLDTSKTPLPEPDDNTYAHVKQVLADPVTSFVEGLRKDAGMSVEAGRGGGGTLVITGVVKEMDPGSRSARYWAGFGAGAARTALELVVKDGGSGKTLLKITQERRSGIGMGGGGYSELLNRNLRAIGKDVAMVVNAF